MQDKILENLNEQQRAAVLQKDGAILIIAGAMDQKKRRVCTQAYPKH